jgi:archaeosine synthase
LYNILKIGELLNQRETTAPIHTIPSFYHPAFEDAYQFIIRHYPVPHRDICIFLPCALKKPYSTSPSHMKFNELISGCMQENDYHIVVFGTCGVVPRELERMYPFTHYKFNLGRCNSTRIKNDFLTIETARLEAYLVKTRHCYTARIAYCLGDFREAMKAAVERTGISMRILPSDALIAEQMRDDGAFRQGSLNMDKYLAEFKNVLRTLKNEKSGE